MESFGRQAIGEEELDVLGAITANLLREAPLADTGASSTLREERRLDLGHAFEVAAPSTEAYDPLPSGQQVVGFLRAVMDCSDVSQSSVVAAFVLIMRMLGSARLGGGSWQLAWLVAICLAQKGLDDVPLANCEFPTVLALCAPERAAIDAQRFNRLEHATLAALDWKTHVSTDVFAQVVAELEHMAAAARREAAAVAEQHEEEERRGNMAEAAQAGADAGVWHQESATTAPLLILKTGPGARLASPFVRPSPSEASRFPACTGTLRKEQAQQAPGW